jgi:phosphate transport system substrate-binding protein
MAATATLAATQAATATKAAMTAPTATTAPVVASTEWEPRQLTAKLSGSGASFPNPLYQVWISVYTKNVVPGVQLSYSSVGSGQGQKDFIAYLTDFGGSDSAIKSGDVESKAPDAIHLPMVMGGVMPMVNIAGIKTPLKFTPETLAGIYLGAITNWNDPRLAKDNEGVALPDLAITPVYRSDSSGTTSIWTDYLSKISTDWKSKVGSGSAVSFPAGIGASGNSGVSATVLNTNGAVGYVEVGYALAAGFPLPYVKNASGNFVKPETNNVSAAANGMNISSNPQKLASSITNSAAPDAYPIAAFTYILVRQKTYTDANKAQALADFIYWGLTTGQGATVRLGYAPLPEAMRTASMKALMTVTVNGAPIIDAPIK